MAQFPVREWRWRAWSLDSGHGQLGLVFPGHLVGVHLNTLYAPVPSGEADHLTDEEKARHDGEQSFRATGIGYLLVQATRPQTLAYGLTDSPAGQSSALGAA
jgi:epoxide hydrolase